MLANFEKVFAAILKAAAMRQGLAESAKSLRRGVKGSFTAGSTNSALRAYAAKDLVDTKKAAWASNVRPNVMKTLRENASRASAYTAAGLPPEEMLPNAAFNPSALKNLLASQGKLSRGLGYSPKEIQITQALSKILPKAGSKITDDQLFELYRLLGGTTDEFA